MFCENINQELQQKLSVYVSKDFSGKWKAFQPNVLLDCFHKQVVEVLQR